MSNEPKEQAKSMLDACAEAGVPIAAVASALVPAAEASLAKPPPAKPAKKGPARKTVVKRVTDEESGAWADVVLDGKTGDFTCTVKGWPEEIIGSQLGPVVKKVVDALRGSRAYQWRPVIVVQIGSSRFNERLPDRTTTTLQWEHAKVTQSDVDVRLRTYRLEIAPKPGDPTRFVCRPHAEDVAAADAAERDRMRHYAFGNEEAHTPMGKRRAGTDVGTHMEDRHAITLPYTPELWAAVCRAEAELLQVIARLRALLGGEPAALAALGARILSGETPRLALPQGAEDEEK